MRRPGCLGGTSYWFGVAAAPTFPRSRFGANPCVVCKDGRCKNICTKEQQMKRIRQKQKKIRAKAAKTEKFVVTKNTNKKAFALRPGEHQTDRLQRLEKEGLYVSGALMSLDYANLVRFGTTDKMKVAEIKRERRAIQRAKNIERYGTADTKKIVEIEKRGGPKKEKKKRGKGLSRQREKALRKLAERFKRNNPFSGLLF